MPSLSLSGSGQPSSSSKESRSSGSLGQRSSTSRIPSWSLSGSGQPSSSWTPSRSSGSSGQESPVSTTRSPSRSWGASSGGGTGSVIGASGPAGTAAADAPGSGRDSVIDRLSRS